MASGCDKFYTGGTQMKLKNKKTGEIGYPYFQHCRDRICTIVDENAIKIADYSSLAELNAEWEDYKELKDPYFITEYGEVFPLNVYEDDNSVATVDEYKQIGNYFGSREEAEKAVEKLKAWKRLKAKGFRFGGWETDSDGDLRSVLCNRKDGIQFNNAEALDMTKDLDLLFGGEECS